MVGGVLQSPTSHCWMFYLSAHLSVQAGNQWLRRKWPFCHRNSWHSSNILQHYPTPSRSLGHSVPPLPLSIFSLPLWFSCELFKPSMKSPPTLLLTDRRSVNSRTSVYTALSDNPSRSPFTSDFLCFIAGIKADLRLPVACLSFLLSLFSSGSKPLSSCVATGSSLRSSHAPSLTDGHT